MQAQPQAIPNDGYLSTQSMLLGGFSILVCLAAWAFMDVTTPVHTVANLAVALAFVVNDPHFLVSYTLLYGDYRKRILTQRRYFWAAVVVPICLVLAIGVALYKANAALMAHIITGMYFLVGWHYVKQIFGCVIVTSVQRGIFYSAWQRRLLLFNLTATWAMSWLGPHSQPENFDYYGISHYSMNLPPYLMTVIFVLVGTSLVGVLGMQLHHYVQTGQKPAPPAVTAFVAIYAWYLPMSYHPGFGYLVPFFHSLQYLALVWQMKKNEVAALTSHMRDRELRTAWVKMFGGYALRAVVLGVLAFEVVPQFLDKQGWVASTSLGATPILVAVLLFINIHHYFIDNVIWRSDNETVRKYLFHTAPPASAGKETRRAA
ncbi:MAG: hypothetical protein KF799_01710 [Bdellovibrionales bacterium]|nr:hypothetical protein [Bdellovibrionales bacterium]